MNLDRAVSGNSSPGESNSDGFVDVQEEIVDCRDEVIEEVTQKPDSVPVVPSTVQNLIKEGENNNQVASGLCEFPKYSTPVRTTPPVPVVDGRTISRSKKTGNAVPPNISPILSDAEIIRRRDASRAIEKEGEMESQNVKHSSIFGVEKNESALAPPEEAPPRSEALNGTFEITAPAATSSPVDSMNINKRARQQTMVVQSGNSQLVKQVFASLQENGDQDDAERKILALVAKVEKDCNAKLETQQAALKQQIDVKNTVLNLQLLHIGDLQKIIKRIGEQGLSKAAPSNDVVDKAAFDSLRLEYKQLEEEYVSVRDMYSKLFECKNLIEKRSDLYREAMEDHKKKEEEVKRCYQTMSDRYDRLRVDAHKKLNSANEMIAALKKQQVDETQHIKMALRQKETALLAAQNQLQLKTEEAAELHKICDTLVAAQETNSLDGSEYEA